MDATTFTAQLTQARHAYDWATKASAPLPADLLDMLRAHDPVRFDTAMEHIRLITLALPYLQEIRDELEAHACYRCSGTGEYGGASNYTRNGRKYCFTCGGTGKATTKTTPAKTTTAPATKPTPAAIPEVPAGRYTVDGQHYKIDRPTDGRWAGYTFIREIDTNGHEINDIRSHTAKIIICAAVAADPQGTLIAYGKATGTCGKCQLDLRDPESVARGIGPYCEADLKGISVNAVYRERKANPQALVNA